MSKSPTTGRASEPTPAQLKELFAQIESGRISKERLQEFLRGQGGLKFPSYSVIVDYGRTVEQMIRNGQYDRANDNILSRNFLSSERGIAQIDVILLNFDLNISSEDAIRDMGARGLRPATLKELLALGVVYPNLQRENPIVALGSKWRDPDGDVGVPCLGWDGGHRHLCLGWFVGPWSPLWRFAAVRRA